MNRLAPRQLAAQQPAAKNHGVPTAMRSSRNRLGSRRAVWALPIATAIALTSASEAAAQFTLPAAPSPTATTPAKATTTTTTPPSAEAGRALLTRAAQAIAAKDLTTAVQCYRGAAAMTKAVPSLATDVAKLGNELVGRGIEPELLVGPPLANVAGNNPATLNAIPDAIPIAAAPPADMAMRKQEALRLIAVGRSALDRGDVATAVTLAQQAQSLNVPEREFAPGEPRVWQFLLDADSAARRSGVALTSGTMPASGDNGVTQAGYGGAAPGEAQSQVAQVQDTQPLVMNRGNYGEQLYAEGMQRLADGDSEAAREKFVEAWKYEAELPVELRNQLKQKLTLVQPSRLPSATAQADPGKPMTAMEKAALDSQSKTQRLYREVTSELARASEMKESQPLQAVDALQAISRRVEASDVDDAAKRSLSSMVSRAISEQQAYVEANRAQIDLDTRNESIRMDMATDAARKARIDDEISALVETYNDLMKEKRFSEAEQIAKQVAELEPDGTISISMFQNSRMGTRMQREMKTRADLEEAFAENMWDTSRSAVQMRPDQPFVYGNGTDWAAMSRMRLQDRGNNANRSPAEQAIFGKLETMIDAKYVDRPLREVIDDLAAMVDIPIVIDNRALMAQRLDSSTPISLNLNTSIPLKNALNLMLRDSDLTYVIRNDVLMITTQDVKRSYVEPRTYRVTDLVTPIPNFSTSNSDGLAGALQAAYQLNSRSSNVQVMPISSTDLGLNSFGQTTGGMTNPLAMGQYNAGGISGGGAPTRDPNTLGGGSMADFNQLMMLIQTTIEPTTWAALGGPSDMQPFPANLSLVVSTTSDVHDQIEDLLESLRRLQNLQITIEVRFITLSDTFFEQIGVDFDIQFDDNVRELPTDDRGPAVTIGLSSPGVPTTDLDIRLDNNVSGLTPPFGGAATQVSSLGFAILSDIEAFFFLQAVQGNSRSNVMQAPKVTLFDGQLATINDNQQRPFVTSIIPVVGDFAVAQQPVIVVLNEGTQLQVQGVVSDDKRYVRLTLVPFFSQIGDVDTFTFEGRRRISRNTTDQEDTNGDGVVDEDDAVDTETENDVIEGTTVQLPTFAFTSVSTTVSVPDGGTIMLGGIKRLSEGRVERGVPLLSKIPYLSRLFRNTSIGRESSSLMMMVTPRIIIEEEEELAQTGFVAPR